MVTRRHTNQQQSRWNGRWTVLAAAMAATVVSDRLHGQWFGPGGQPAIQTPAGPPTVVHLPAATQPLSTVMANPFSQHAHPAATPWTPAPAGQPPDWSQIDQLLASAAEFERNGSSWQAINAYRQAIQLDPQNHRALLSFARMKHRARDFAGAVSLYQQLLRNYPNDPLALNDLGLCYARMGDAARAIGALQLAVQHRPDSKRYRNNLAVVLVEANQWDAALQTLIPIHGPAVANYNVAWLLARQGQNDRSISYLNAALLADPSFRPAIDLLAQVEPTGSRIASTPTETGSVDQAPVIQLRGGILSESAKTSPAVYQTDAGELPPNLNDYRIPGMPRVE